MTLNPHRDPRVKKQRDYRHGYGHRRWPRMADRKARRAQRLADRRVS